MPIVMRHKPKSVQPSIEEAVVAVVSTNVYSIHLTNLSPPYNYFQVPTAFDASKSFSIDFSLILASPGISDDQTIFEQGATNQFAMFWSNANENLRIISNGAMVLKTPVTHKLSKGATYDVSISFDNDTSTISITIDGELLVSANSIPTPPSIPTPLYFGCRVSSNDYPLSGMLNNIKIINS